MINLYTSQQVYAIEQAWFDQGHDSFGLMQQAAWQMTQKIIKMTDHHEALRACVWVGQGNNGGDGWLVAHYLQQAGWQVQIVTIGFDKEALSLEGMHEGDISDAVKAQQMALQANCPYHRLEDLVQDQGDEQIKDSDLWSAIDRLLPSADVYIDAIFGIGLDRAPAGVYKLAITAFNHCAQKDKALVIAVDIPSGLVASTGQVFDQLAVSAEMTLCLVARKFGLHTKDGMDYAGRVEDLPLIPHVSPAPVATLLDKPFSITARQQNSYKGSYGHVLIIGGNRIDGSQGMGGAAILSASSAMATGAGKITVACHTAFHGALLTSLPDAMTIDLHDTEGVKHLIADASVIAIGMGLGRDDAAAALFSTYLKASMNENKALVIDADGLYHLATLHHDDHELADTLREYSRSHTVRLTPHSGEAARLLNQSIGEVEADRLGAIGQCASLYGGDWVLKGAGSLVCEQGQCYVCATGNAGMASAGMGDVLSGVNAGLLAQQDMTEAARSLRQAVLVHGQAGDVLVNQNTDCTTSLMIGQRGLQAQDMPAAIRHVMAGSSG